MPDEKVDCGNTCTMSATGCGAPDLRLTLTDIAEWLSGDTPPSEEQAQELFEVIIPAALDLETLRLQVRVRGLLEAAHAAAKLSPASLHDALQDLVGEEAVPSSCAVCCDVKPIYSYGDYTLGCLHGMQEEAAPRPALAAVSADEAFSRPVLDCHALLLERVKGKPVPLWCPRRPGR